MNRDVIYQVGHQQVKRKKGACKKEIIHGMQVDAANRRQNKQHEKEKQQRYGSEGADSPRQRTGLQLLRKRESDFVARYQVLVTPDQLRSSPASILLRRRKCVLRKIEPFEIRCEPQLEITNLAHLVAKTVVPGIQTLRAVTDIEHRRLMRRHSCLPVRLRLLVLEHKRRPVHGENHV